MKVKMYLFKKQFILQVFVLLGIAYLFVFNIMPMFGLMMAFNNYKITDGIIGIFTSQFVGLKHFRDFVSDFWFWPLVRNTAVLSFGKIIFTFPVPIIFALMLNEVRNGKIKKAVQTVSYLPNFISWIIVVQFIMVFFTSDTQTGVINRLLVESGLISKPISFLTNSDAFLPMAIISAVWKEMGWWSIIFLAAIAGIDVELYEAAEIDGATRMGKIFYITLQGIRPVITTVLILSLGNVFGGGLGGSNFEQSFLLGNPMNLDRSQIIQTYVFKIGFSEGRYAFATAVGLIQSLISLSLVLGSNWIAGRVSDSSLF